MYVPMVLIVDGNTLIGGHERSNLCYFIWHLITSRAVTNLVIFSKNNLFSFICAQLDLSNLAIKVPWYWPWSRWMFELKKSELLLLECCQHFPQFSRCNSGGGGVNLTNIIFDLSFKTEKKEKKFYLPHDYILDGNSEIGLYSMIIY